MNKPKYWHIFRFKCDLHVCSFSNMLQPEKRYFCKRKDRQGRTRKHYELLRCHWNVCPKLKSNNSHHAERKR